MFKRRITTEGLGALFLNLRGRGLSVPVYAQETDKHVVKSAEGAQDSGVRFLVKLGLAVQENGQL